MSNSIKITFEELKGEQKDILVAELAEIGFEGFEEGDDSLDAYISENSFDKNLFMEIINDLHVNFRKHLVEERNWNEVWESNYAPVIVDDFCAIRAAFHSPVKNVKHEIVITPKMSFGTGHHATTRMMILQLRDLDLENKEVFDFGTGTGILAILSEKLGAKKIVGVDNDPWSIENANENLKLNVCTNTAIYLSSEIPAQQKFDLVLANINRNVILENINAITESTHNNGVILLSGFLETDREEIITEMSGRSFQLENELSMNQWVCQKFSNVRHNNAVVNLVLSAV